ncbi:hypothetical protein N7456_003650 [Penicillium angulare]|uniref:Uncharacterized protein n=1 Tax=Penicillium angulare TaxID=116970 RepID=A0A9W9FV16_9EURO|nr:hypothetical protein N7456_003650 [Penicillium angulare]
MSRIAKGKDRTAERKLQRLSIEYPNSPAHTYRATDFDRGMMMEMFDCVVEDAIHLTALKELVIHIRPPQHLVREADSLKWDEMVEHFQAISKNVFTLLEALPNLDSFSIKNLPPWESLLPGRDVHEDDDPPREYEWRRLPLPPTPRREDLGDDWSAPRHRDRYSKKVLKRHSLKKLSLTFITRWLYPINLRDEVIHDCTGPTVSHWIKPVEHSLEELSISFHGYNYDFAEPIYQYDPELPFMPNLKRLELRQIIFTSDKVFKWIISHGKTLESLVLDDCSIMYSRQIPDHKVVEEPDKAILFIDAKEDGKAVEVPVEITYMRWAHWLDRFKVELPHLRVFKIGSSRIRTDADSHPACGEEKTKPTLNHYPEFLFGLFPDRYLAAEIKHVIITPKGRHEGDFTTLVSRDQTIPYEYWIDAKDDEEDHKALCSLVYKLKLDVPETTGSAHCGYVKDFMGRVTSKW